MTEGKKWDAPGPAGQEAGSREPLDPAGGSQCQNSERPNPTLIDGVLDGEDGFLIPGLIDLHFHGCLGLDVCDTGDASMGEAEAMELFRRIAEYELSSGITGIAPATLTLPAEDLKRTLRRARAFRDGEHGKNEASLCGLNMEGPFISHEKKGAQNGKYILPADAVLAEDFLESSGGLVKILGLAPEENPDFSAYISALKDRAHISLAHTNADYETAMRAFRAGADHAVHLFNAMSAISHRAPGVPGAVFDSANVRAELIADGIHVHPAMVRLAFRLLGRERVVMISDSLRCVGMPDGKYMLGGQAIRKEGRYCRLEEGGAIAGSVSNLMDCLRTAVLEMGIPLESAVTAASENPARVLGVFESMGSIEEGKAADLVLLRNRPGTREHLQVAAVFKNGELIRPQAVL